MLDGRWLSAIDLLKSRAGYSLRTEFGYSFFVKGETECTSERARGQSIFLVQLRKMLAGDFRGGTRMKHSGKHVPLNRLQGLASI